MVLPKLTKLYLILCIRFKQLPYATEEDKNSVATDIKEMLTKLIHEESGDNTIIKNEDEPPSKKSRLSGKYLER